MEILIKVLTGTADINNVNKDILFKAMVRTTGGQYSKRLGLYYGDPDPEDEEFWEEKSGLEIFYTNPVPDPGLPSYKTPSHAKTSSIQSPKSITALLKASLATYQATADSALLWKQVIKWKMPWFQEAQDLTDGELLQQKDTMDLLLWLDDMTTGKLFMEGPFMSIANRRRIWGVCEQLKHEYDTLMALLEQRPLPEHVFHAEIMRFSFQTSAFVGFAALEQDPLVQQECFLDDFSKKEFLFEAYWDVEGSLIGLRLAFAGDERVWRNRSGNWSLGQHTGRTQRSKAKRQNHYPRQRQKASLDGGLPDYELSELQFSRKQIMWKGDLSQHFHDLRNIKRISGRVAMASPSNGAESEQKLGRSSSRPRTGQDGVKPNWKEDEVLHFDIDGPGGEMVTEINHFTMRSSNSISLKLRTNRGREMNFGPDWSADEFCRDFRAQEEHAIVGIALSFVARSGVI
ncbi:hypothetical protein SLS56_005181 [Neofusicoccum ribis]|uniref:Uncharacterized protein n=1 Tax=Neofusicoccum ribis TaxID=45134 RepID=A0ABR3SUJ6_9PEZI